MHQTSTGTNKNQKSQKFQQLLRSGPIVPGNFSFFGFFGACAGLVHLVVCFFCFFWCLCRFGDSDFTKHWQAPTKTKKTKPLDAPNIDRHQKNQKNQKFQQLLRSGPIVPGNFSFFVFFGACAGLVHLVVWFFCFFLVPVQVWWLWLHKTLTGTKKNKNSSNYSEVDP